MSAARRDFLKHAGLGAAALAGLPSALHAAARTSVATPEFSSVDWQQGVEQPQPQAVDTTWTEKLTGKYKAVFDVPEIHGGTGVWRGGLWLNHYRDVLKAQPSDLNSVIVIRHAAIPLIMSQAYWETYDVAKANKVVHPMTDKKTQRNPVLMTPTEDGLTGMLAGLTLDKQMERGAIVLACGMAFSSVIRTVGAKDKLSAADARTKAMSMVHPGVIMQPNGIFGVTLAQHHGCVFVAAS